RITADASEFGSRRNAHAAEEWMKRNHDPRKQRCCHCPLVERDDFRRRAANAVFWKESAAAVVTVVDSKVYRKHLHFEHITRFRFLDVDRTGQNMTSRTSLLPCDFGNDCLQRFLNLAVGNTGSRESHWSVGQERVHVDDVA